MKFTENMLPEVFFFKTNLREGSTIYSCSLFKDTDDGMRVKIYFFVEDSKHTTEFSLKRVLDNFNDREWYLTDMHGNLAVYDIETNDPPFAA